MKVGTRAKIRGCKEPVRTILHLSEHEKGKNRFYPIYTTDEDTPIKVQFRDKHVMLVCEAFLIKLFLKVFG